MPPSRINNIVWKCGSSVLHASPSVLLVESKTPVQLPGRAVPYLSWGIGLQGVQEESVRVCRILVLPVLPATSGGLGEGRLDALAGVSPEQTMA